MDGHVIPFPLARRHDLVGRQAQWFAVQGHAAAERNLRRQLQMQYETLKRRGVSSTLAAEEVEALQAAIRREIARYLRASGASA